MATIRIGYSKDLRHYQTKRYDSENFDVKITMENGDIVEVNTRPHGFAIRHREYGSKGENKLLIDKDY